MKDKHSSGAHTPGQAEGQGRGPTHLGSEPWGRGGQTRLGRAELHLPQSQAHPLWKQQNQGLGG